MSMVYAAQIQTTIKEILRRTEGKVTREQLVADAVLELDVGHDRVAEQLDTLNRLGEVYHVGDGGDAEVRIP